MSSSNNTILISGATGKLGKLILDRVLEGTSAKNVRAIARDPLKLESYAKSGVDVVKADFDHPESLVAALKGVDTALLISSTTPGIRLRQHTAFIDAARQNGVKHLVYTSLLHADTSKMSLAEEHLATEKVIEKSGVPATILRNGWYLENYTDQMGQFLQQKGLIGATKNGKISAATRADFAEATAYVLLGKHGIGGKYEFAGDTGFTMDELAAEISKQTGENIGYTEMDADSLHAILSKAPIPAFLVDVLVDSDAGIARGDLADNSGDLRKLLGHPTTTLAEGVAAGLKKLNKD